MTCFLTTCQPEGFLFDLPANLFSELLYLSLFACRNQQSLKLYTGFFIPINKNFTFCRLVNHFACPTKSLDLSRESQRF